MTKSDLSSLTLFLAVFCVIYSPVDSSRFGSSGNLSQSSSQLSETGQESTGGSEPEESFHSYHSTRFHPSSSGQPFNSANLTVNGHTPVGEKELRQLAPEVGQTVKKDPPVERSSSKLLRYQFSFVNGQLKMMETEKMSPHY